MPLGFESVNEADLQLKQGVIHMLNKIEKFQLTEIAEQYWAESRTEHDESHSDEDACIGCRKMRLAGEILRFIQDFGGESGS